MCLLGAAPVPDLSHAAHGSEKLLGKWKRRVQGLPLWELQSLVHEQCVTETMTHQIHVTCGVQIRSQLEHRVLQIQEVVPNNQQAHKNCVLLTIQENFQSTMEYPSISLHHKAAPKSTSTFLYDHTHTLQIPFPVCFINEGFACIWKPIQKWLSG